MIPRLHMIADDDGADLAPLLRTVESALGAGVPCVQLRTKAGDDRRRLDAARAVADACHQAGAVCIVNDRVDIAVAAGADGAHVGPDDLPPSAARRILQPPLLLGASARAEHRVSEALEGHADYLGVGPCYATSSKAGLPDPIGPAGMAAIAGRVGIPVIAIGGVTAERVGELLAAGAHGVAVIGAIGKAADPATAVRELLAAIAEATDGR